MAKSGADFNRLYENNAKVSILDHEPYTLSDLTHALCKFSADYHGGQKSRGYRLLNRAIRRANRQGCMRPLDAPMSENACDIYAELEITYSERL